MDTALNAIQVSHSAAKSLHQHIFSWEDLPQWMQSDPYIRRGYRRQLDSFDACLRSVFYLHNESVNIWSHLVPTLAYLVVLLATDFSTLRDSKTAGVQLSAADNAVLQTYTAGSIVCLMFSVGVSPSPPAENKENQSSSSYRSAQAWYHIVAAHSERMATRFLKLDYLGILLNVAACAITFIYAGLYGKPGLQAFYISLFVVCATFVLSTILSPLVDGPHASLRR